MQQTSTVKVPAIFQKVLKTVRTLRVNETKLTSGNAFISNIFALKSKKKKGRKNPLVGLRAES